MAENVSNNPDPVVREVSIDDNTAYEVNDTNLEGPYNPTDLIVYLEKARATPITVKKYHEQDMEGDNTDPQPDKEEHSLNVVGIKVPIINLNGLEIFEQLIVYVIIQFESLTPTLELRVLDNERKIRNKNLPLTNNFITVSLVPPIQYAYKNMVMEFYVTDIIENDIDHNHYITYRGEYKNNDLNNIRLKQIEFPGCEIILNSNEETSGDLSESQEEPIVIKREPKKDKLTTWEYLYTIALENGLGFAATPDIIEHEDALPRFIYSQSLLDFIKHQMTFSGKDNDHHFDIWIDEYNTLCVANVHGVLNNKTVSPHNLTLLKASSPTFPFTKSPEPEYKEAHRTITNYTHNTEYIGDLFIEWYQLLIDNTSTYYEGTLTQTYAFKPKGSTCEFDNGDPVGNSVLRTDYQLDDENSSSTSFSDYNTSHEMLVTTEFNDYPTEAQKIMRKKYFNKINSKILKVRLADINHAIHRGMLINVAIYTDGKDQTTKLSLLNYYQQLAFQYVDDQNPDILEEIDPEVAKDSLNKEQLKMEIASNPDIQLPLLWLNGIFYVTKVEYIYDPSGYSNTMDDRFYKDIQDNSPTEKINQYLYLIKNGPIKCPY